MRDERRQRLKAELIARLERVRGQMTDAEFDRLVTARERTSARFAEIDARPYSVNPAGGRKTEAGDPTTPDDRGQRAIDRRNVPPDSATS